MTSASRSSDQASVAAFLETVEHPTRRADAVALDQLFRKVTGWQPQMWGRAIVGYGSYHYRYDSGREGDWLATGFSPGAARLSIYIMPGYQDHGDILARLGKHKTGKACVYINKLSDVNVDILAELIRTGVDRLGDMYHVSSS